MEIREVNHSSYTTLIPVGDLDANSSMEMDGKIKSVMDEGKVNLHIDCSELQYISSAGLGVFISFMEDLKEAGGMFVFSDMPDNIYKVFELLGLHQILKIVKSEADVAGAFER